MGKREKLINKIIGLGNISFKEAEGLLKDYGYVEGSSGSHHTFRKKGRPSVTIVYRNPHIHREAVRDLKRIIEIEEQKK